MYTQMKKDDAGYIVVETAGAFIPFVLLVISILSLVNIITLQVRTHYALTQAAGTVSMYCYVLQAAGIADELAVPDAKSAAFADNASDVIDAINALSGSGDALADTGRVFDTVETFAGNPAEMVQGFANYGLNGLKNAASAGIVKPLVLRYLADAQGSGEEYLRRVRIDNFEITQCTIIDSYDNVKLTAEYEAEYTFGVLRLPFTPALRISQSVATKAWLGGSGEGYKG